MLWSNYFVPSTRSYASEGHIPAESLRDVIKNHNGEEAYHCAYDLEPRPDFSNYDGLMRPALGYVWFDFDSHDGGVQALADTCAFVAWLNVSDLFICYSGSKGFHVGVPFSYFGLDPSKDLGRILNRLASKLKETYKSLDTTIYNANRKFRALGSKHPKTGLYKTEIRLQSAIDGKDLTMEECKRFSALRASFYEIPVPHDRGLLKVITDLLEETKEKPKKEAKPKKEWEAPPGVAAFAKCSFLAHCKDKPSEVNEPQWYAALSIVSRFQDGRQQCHGISHGHPGYSAANCNDKIDQALAESAPRTCANVATMWDGCKSCPLNGKINSPVNIYDTKFWKISEKGALIPQYNELLLSFCNQHAYKTIADMKTVFVYNGTHYEEHTPIEIKAFAEKSFEPKPQEKVRQEFCHKIFANEVTRRSFFIETTANKINFENGILDLNEQISASSVGRQERSGSNDDSKDRSASQATFQLPLKTHSAKIGFRGVLPYRYDTSATCPTFDWWIKDVMLGDEDLVKILQEFMGYVVRGGEYKYHKALWLSGSGRNGKSTFLSVLKALIGVGNYSTLSIRQIIGDKFSSADLDGKIANFSEETSPEELSDSGPFKNLTGDGELLAQKKYGDPYSFRNRAKLIMTYNEVPILKDLSPGMMSRPIIVPWKRDLLAEGEKQDRTLQKKLLAELPGIFNFALRGWERLEEQQDFTDSPKTSASLQEVQSASCSATRWIEEQVTFLPNGGKEYDARGLYAAYKAWHSDAGGTPMGEMKFLKRLNAHPEVRKRKHRDRNKVEFKHMRIGEKTSEIFTEETFC